ncbi:MAG: hypothetical protein OHK0029_32110 [Armatimonadaceae bacterium]
MAYSVTSKKTGKVYFLHAKTTPTKGGERTIYYFAGQEGEGTLNDLPDGYTVTESEKTGLPLLKKK